MPDRGPTRWTRRRRPSPLREPARRLDQTSSMSPSPTSPGEPPAAHLDTTLPTEERVERLVEQMTLAEKLAQLGGVWSTGLVRDDAFSARGRRRGHGARHGPGHPHRRVHRPAPRGPAHACTNDIQHWLVDRDPARHPGHRARRSRRRLLRPRRDAVPPGDRARLDVGPGPGRRTWRTTSAASCSPSAPARRSRPVLDVARDPRWGRVEETYGEDPVLVGTLGQRSCAASASGPRPNR